MRLAELQRLFWAAITHPTGIEDFLATADETTRKAFDEAFAQTDAFGRRERMQVYAEAYFYRLLQVLGDQFELTAWLAGKAPFHDLVTDYVLACPSTDPDVRRFGARFPAFIEEHELGRRVEGLAELARVEWAIIAAVDAPDDAPLGRDALTVHPLERWPTLRFVATGPTRLLTCRLPLSQLWRDYRAGSPAPSAPAALPRPCDVLVWRSGYEVYHRQLEPAEARALAALLRGASFAEICAAASEGDPSGPNTAGPRAVAQRLDGWLHDWLRAGLIAGVRAPDDAATN